jgi:signal transduction histidine kinase
MDEAPPEREAAATEARAWPIRMHELRTPLTVVLGRTQLARRRLRRGDDPAQIDAEMEALEAALARLVAAVERLDRLDSPD